MPNNQRTVKWGYVKDGVFYKQVVKSKHLHRKLNAWGFDKNIVEGEILKQAHTIILNETEEKKFYYAKSEMLAYKGVEMDFGFGTQVFLPIRYWVVVDSPVELAKLVGGENGKQVLL